MIRTQRIDSHSDYDLESVEVDGREYIVEFDRAGATIYSDHGCWNFDGVTGHCDALTSRGIGQMHNGE